MKIDIDERFSEKQLDSFIDKIFNNYKNIPNDKYFFNFSNIEWISLQNLVVLKAILKYFSSMKIEFELSFFETGKPIGQIPKRVAMQIVQLWDTFVIKDILPQEMIEDYNNVYGYEIGRLKKEYDIKLARPEIYKHHEILPIIILENIKNYKDKEIERLLDDYLSLNQATLEIVRRHNCEHPFISNVLGKIISKELYENFLDHFEHSLFESKENYAFMGLTLQGKLDETKNTDYKIQKRLRENFEKEIIPEAEKFFKDEKTNKYKNQSYIQYTFLDFGKGIVNTLKEQYIEKNNIKDSSTIKEGDIIKFAFKHDSSRHSIYDKFGKEDFYIPRGLFDVLCIVKRYEGLLLVRSNYGKILFDFSNKKTIEEAYSSFGDNNLFFPGTILSIYLPAIELGKIIDKTVIKPVFTQPNYTAVNKKYVDLYQIISNLNSDKDNLYTNLIKELYETVNSQNEKTIIYFSFRGCEIDTRLTKKLIYFLLTNYEFNINKNIVILHPPEQIILDEINEEILNLSSVIKNYKIHPLPFIYYHTENKSLKLYWLGIFDEEDKIKLNDLLFDSFSLAKSDFNDPDNIVGHLNYFDTYGNLISSLPNREKIIQYYEDKSWVSDENTVEKLIVENDCLIRKNEKDIYLCNGGYYQYEFLNLINLLDNRENCNLVSKILYNRLSEKLNNERKYKYIGITSSSHKIIRSLIKQNILQDEDGILLDNFYSFTSDEKLNQINSNFSYVLVCDVIATGARTEKLIGIINGKGADLEYIAVIANTIDPQFGDSINFINKYNERIISLYPHKMEKFVREGIKKDLQSKNIVRINPFTNIPVTLSIENTNINSVLIKDNIEFLNLISEDQVKVGYLKYNNVIHPYFFDTKSIIENNGEQLLSKIFINIKLEKKNLKILYPKKSSIEFLDFKKFKNIILKDQSVDEHELERFTTPEGWKFPHTTNYFRKIINNKKVLILDDGSCTGDSIIQMINQIHFFNPQEIIVLSLIGRVNDYKREFFSIISEVKKKIKLTIYFGTHWHIPTYYLDNNPNTIERDWLNEIISLQNTPNSIKKIAMAILKELEPKDEDDFKDYKYLPRKKNGKNEIPKKDLMRVRDEIGKVIGLRFYKEGFIYFDEFIKKYESNIYSKDRYKEIELLCAAITYEPYLFINLEQVLPDIVEKIKEFVNALIFGNPNRGNKILDFNSLYYKWDRKNLVHLFFIVFRDTTLVDKLKNTDNFIKLINFLDSPRNTIDYILYKLLYYIPLNKNELNEKINDGLIKNLIHDLIDKNKLFKNELKRFYSFLSTLPSKNDFDSQLVKLRDSYIEQKSNTLHDQKATFNHNISALVIQLRIGIDQIEKGSEISEETLRSCQDYWFSMVELLHPILSFTNMYSKYLEPYPYDKYNKTLIPKLRDQISYIQESLIPKNKSSISIEKLSTILEMVSKIQLNFGIDTDINKIFEFSKTNLKYFVKTLLSSMTATISGFKIDNIGSINDDINIKLPLLYAERLIIKELCTNLSNYAKVDKSIKVELEFKPGENSYILTIINEISERENSSGGGEGMRSLNVLTSSKLFGFNYTYDPTKNGLFKQTLVFNY